MTYLTYDLVILAVLALFAWMGYRRGFVLTLCSLLAVFVALIGASILSNALAEPAAKMVEPIVANQIHDTVTSYHQRTPALDAASQDEAGWLEQLPLEELLEPLRESRFFQGYAETFQRAVDEGIAEATANIAQALAHFVAIQVARIIIFIAAFFAVLIAWRFISHALDLVVMLPVLYTANRWGGGAVGLVKGSLVVFIAVWLLRGSYIPPEAVEGSRLLKFFASANPLSFFL